jgi:thiol-disulfide isomerase/thioredoxin
MRYLRSLFAAGLAFSTAVGTLRAEDETAPPAPKGAAAKDPAATPEKPDPFAVPEGTDPEVMQGFLQGLARMRPKKQTPAAFRELLRNIEGAATEVSKREVDEPTALLAANLRYGVLNMLQRFQDPNAAQDQVKLVEALKKDSRPAVVERGTVLELLGRIGAMGELETAARKQLIEDVGAFIRGGELSAEKVEFASMTTDALEQLGDYELAVVANNLYAKYLEARNDDQLKDMIDRMRAANLRLELPGHSMEVKGKTLAGEEFDLAKLKGKVVLVDFWATWCGPCVAEMPHVKELYEAYNGKGFEVVGISLDKDRDELERFIVDNHIPWSQLLPEAEEDRGPKNPIAAHYGIFKIPTAILVDQAGNVVSLNARDRELTKQLAALLGPVELKSEKDATEKTEEAPVVK